MSDNEKLELQAGTPGEEDSSEESSFAKWLPPALSTEPADKPPEATLTGLGPATGRTPQGVSEEEPPIILPADADDDDEPTQIITNLFPELLPKLRSSPVGSGPINRTLFGGSRPVNELPPSDEAPPEPDEDAETTQLGVAPAGSKDDIEILEKPASSPLDARGIENAATQQAELLAALVEGLGAARSTPSVRYNADTVLREGPISTPGGVELPDGLPLLSPPDVPVDRPAGSTPAAPLFPPTVLIAQPNERERPTAPASRRPLEPALTAPAAPERPRGASPSEPPWAQTVRPKTGSRTALRYGVGAFALSAALTVLVLRALLPGKGSVHVSAVGSDGKAVSNAQVFVDGGLSCSPAPCRVGKLSEGRHVISVSAVGYQAASERTIDVASGDEASVQVALTPTASPGNASLHIRVQAKGLHVYLDGEDRGEAPLSIGGLAPTEHTIRLAGSPLYAPYEQKLTLEPNAALTLTPSLVARQAAIVITPGPGAEGARIEVLGAKEKKLATELPARIEVPLLGSYTVRALRLGFKPLDIPVRFGEGEFEKQVRVALVPADPPAAGGAAAKPLPVQLEESAPAKPVTEAAPVGLSALNMSSVPPANVIVDGKPLGLTPKQLNLPPGNHVVVFVHSTLGRKSVNVKVEPGKSATAAVQF